MAPGSGIDVSSTSITLSEINVNNGSARMEMPNNSVCDRRDAQQPSSMNINVTKTLNGLDVSNNASCDASAISISQHPLFYVLVASHLRRDQRRKRLVVPCCLIRLVLFQITRPTGCSIV